MLQRRVRAVRLIELFLQTLDFRAQFIFGGRAGWFYRIIGFVNGR